jgi:D-arabinose 1-dehydrogenase-like Zn-dependent alcohol dehydrogenase
VCDREGIYPASGFPFVIGKEASGIVVALPTDESVLNDPDYKKRGYKEGSRVAVVWCAVYTLPCNDSPAYRITWVRMRNTFLHLGKRYM